MPDERVVEPSAEPQISWPDGPRWPVPAWTGAERGAARAARASAPLHLWILLILATATVLSWLPLPGLALSHQALASLQLAVRIGASAIALAISLLTWNTRRDQPLRLVLTGYAFFAVAVLSAAELVLLPGMTGGLASRSDGAGLTLHLAADVAAAAGLWAAAFSPSRLGSAQALRLGVAVTVTGIVASLAVAVGRPQEWSRSAGVTASWLVALSAFAVIPSLTRRSQHGRDSLGLIALAALLQGAGIALGSELRGVDGAGLWIDDAWRMGAALLVYLALFREGVLAPWQRLQATGRAAQEHLSRYQQLFESAPDGLLLVDASGRIQHANPAAAAMFRWPLQALHGLQVEALLPAHARELHRRHRAEFQAQPLSREMGSGGPLKAMRRDGESFPVEIALVPQPRDGAGNTLCIVRDVTERRQLERTLMRQAMQDPLTKLPNRRRFYGDLSKALADAERHDRALALMFVDLDHFKQINDTLGHSHGDELLRQVAKRLSTSLRTGDLLARMGGDEFALFLLDAGADDAAAVAAKLLKSLEPPFELQGHSAKVGASIGIALYPSSGLGVEELLSHADIAMYRAKQRGRNTWCLYEQRMSDGARERLNLQQDLVHAIERGQFELAFQPRVRATDGQLSGFEALLRWQHPVHGQVRPDVFIELAEQCGLIVPIGEWVLREACAQASRWCAAGAGALTMAVNVSAHQLRHKDFAASVLQVLEETAWPAEQLELEITETALMEDAREASALLHGLSALGVRIAVDDFGTGYSSLAYLKDFPLHRLKVDRSFVCGLQAEGNDRVIASSIIALAHALGLQVTAEGVESPAQREFLLERDCDEFQGYLFSPPIPAARCADWLAPRQPQP